MDTNSAVKLFRPARRGGTRAYTTVIRIQPRPARFPQMWRDVWEHRALLFLFVWRDITLRYKQTAVGLVWVILQPLLMMVVFSLFFSSMLPTDGLPYPLFVYTGLIVWQLFSKTLSHITVVLKEHESIITRVYFPRIILPLSAVLTAVIDFFVSLSVLLVLMVYYDLYPSWPAFIAPLFIGLAILTALSLGLWLSMMDIVYRDVRQTLPIILQAWMFMTPVIYSTSLVSPGWQSFYALNPMVGVVAGLRWALLGAPQPNLVSMGASAAVLIAILVFGLLRFREVEGNLADTI